MSTLTILALIEMFDESVRPPRLDDVLAGRRADIRLLMATNLRQQPRLTR
jgi:hypothetical protein